MSATATEQKKHETKPTDQSETSGSPTQTMNELFHETMRGYEQALKSGIELHEQSIQFWSDLLGKISSPDQFPSKIECFAPGMDALGKELLPAFRKQMQENIEAFTMMSNQSTSLLRKSTSIMEATSVPDAQKRLQDFMEALLASARMNVHLALNTTSRVMNFWNDSAMRAGRSVG